MGEDHSKAAKGSEFEGTRDAVISLKFNKFH